MIKNEISKQSITLSGFMLYLQKRIKVNLEVSPETLEFGFKAAGVIFAQRFRTSVPGLGLIILQ
jgi:hypothetical protein